MTINKNVKRIAALVVVIGVAAGALAYYQSGSAQQVNAESVEIPVQTETVTSRDITEIISASGTVSAAEENGVYIATTQKVANVYVKLGDVVQIGDLICDYDVDYSRKSLENTLQQQQINLKNAQLNLQNLTTGLTETDVIQYENSIASAEKNILDAQNNLESAKIKITQMENDLSSAQKTVEDNKVLLDVGAITQEAYDQSVDNVSDIEISLKEAKNNLSSYESAIANAEAALLQAEKNYEQAQDPLGTDTAQISYQQQQNQIAISNLTIQNVQDQISDLTASSISHVEGTIIQVNVEEGSIVNDETSIVKIADLNKLIVNANVSEYDAPLLEVGQTVMITTDAIENSEYWGEVSYISPIATVTSTFSGSETTVAIEVAIHNPDGILKPGYSVDMEISVVDLKDTMAVSLGAVMLDARDNQNYVFTVDHEDHLVKTYIEIGVTDDLYVEVLSGLTEGDRVVSSPGEDMEEGTPISMYTTTGAVFPAGENAGSGQEGGFFNMGGQGGNMPAGGQGGGTPPSGGNMPQGGMR